MWGPSGSSVKYECCDVSQFVLDKRGGGTELSPRVVRDNQSASRKTENTKWDAEWQVSIAETWIRRNDSVPAEVNVSRPARCHNSAVRYRWRVHICWTAPTSSCFHTDPDNWMACAHRVKQPRLRGRLGDAVYSEVYLGLVVKSKKKNSPTNSSHCRKSMLTH